MCAGSNLNEGQNIEYTREDDRRFQKGFRGIHMGWTVRPSAFRPIHTKSLRFHD